jgi:hypothetical protein
VAFLYIPIAVIYARYLWTKTPIFLPNWRKICFNVNDSSVPYEYVQWQNQGKKHNFT